MFDPYDWTKNKINSFQVKISVISKDNLATSFGNIWSIKKHLVLDYCLGGFTQIFQNYFKEYYYIDTHCGSGLIGFEESELQTERFPGSPLIAILKDKPHFTKYYFFDKEAEFIDILTQRINFLKTVREIPSYETNTKEFSDSVKFIVELSTSPPRKGFFILVDPKGFKEVTWELIEELLNIPTADIIFIFMTYTIARHRANAENDNQYSKTLDKFYGNQNWKPHIDGESLKKLYMSQLKNKRNHVYDIPVFKVGREKIYNILIATNSDGASNIVNHATKLVKIKTEAIEGAFKNISKKSIDMDEFF